MKKDNKAYLLLKAFNNCCLILISAGMVLLFSACKLSDTEEPTVADIPEVIEEESQNNVTVETSVEETKDDVEKDSDVEDSKAEETDEAGENLYDSETIREFLAKKYTCDTPPFYTVLDHITEDGMYVYHIYESVDNEDESHTATIDWVTVNPKTGEATTYFGETFYISETDIESHEEETEVNVEVLFANAKDCVLTDRDFEFEYNGNTFSIGSKWSDYVDKVGYPKEYEQNNYGYITTDEEGYKWSMRYPVQSDFHFDFSVVLCSPSCDREGKDTFVSHVDLENVATARGVKGGDSLGNLESAYGKPSRIEDFGNDAGWTKIIYENEKGQIVFVTDGKIILYTILIS